MTDPRSILFVCTGNVFRSVAAEYCFKKYLADNGTDGWKVGSAGIIAPPQAMNPKVIETLRELGIGVAEHQVRKLSREMLDNYDIVVGMAEDHIEFMKSEFGYAHGLLFNDLAQGEMTSIWDVRDGDDRQTVEDTIVRTVRDIHAKTSALFKNASERFYLFSDFVAGRVAHRNGYPFITLHETPHSIAFMSIDIPYKEDGHILVIPKQRYIDFAEIPDEILNDLLGAIKKIGNALTRDHGGFNILLNNGRDAGQFMMHAHFHIIPRREGDDIRIEFWKRPKVSQEEFIKLNERLKRQIAAAG